MDQMLKNRDRKAITDKKGAYTYHYLMQASASLAAHLLDDAADLEGARVTFMVSPSMNYVTTLLAIWKAGGCAVPLHVKYPAASVQYVLEDTGAQIIVVDKLYEKPLKPIAEELGIRLINVEELFETKATCELPELDNDRNALIIYTSGTTGKPKGVVTTHRIIEAQIKMLVEAWKWEPADYILNVLPLHHVHGLVNALLCPLWIGATCELNGLFETKEIWNDIENGLINVFMAVPTIYFKLLEDYDQAPDYIQEQRKEALSKFRLMVSGSAALPAAVFDRWKAISGHALLERYGMTEIGMALSNPYEGERRCGTVGQPLPGVSVRLVESGTLDIIDKEAVAGEIQVKSPGLFKAYWNRTEESTLAFTSDGWFKTGDIAELNNGYYKILGRNSTDIIKSGGYKISALEIEEVLRKHPNIEDCAVFALPDEEWGERVAAAIVPKGEYEGEFDKLVATWIREQLPPYKLPRLWLEMEELPRNAMGKVTKNVLRDKVLQGM